MTERLEWTRSLAAACVGLAAFACTSAAPEIRSVAGVAQGTTYSLQWTGDATEAEIAAAAEQELERIDALLSNYRSDSTIERLNALQGTEPIELPAELVTLLELAKRIHRASDGCFDPTVRPLVRAWGFDGDAPAVPPEAILDAIRAVVGLDKLELLDATHVRKTVPNLEIDMASIGQGYTAGQLAALLERHGSVAYLAEIGGEVVARGAKPGGAPWRVGIERPVDDAGAAPALRVPAESRTAVITSGSYRHYLEADDRFFGHIIDPRSGRAVDHPLLSVTVVGEDAATAAAWATALLCLGPRDASLVAERENLAALLWVRTESDAAALQESTAFEARWMDLLELPAPR